MLILYLSQNSIPSRQANAIQIRAMCEAFAGLGHRVHLTALKGSDGAAPLPADSGFVLHTVSWPWQRLRHRILAVHARRLIRRLRPDIVFTRSPLLAHNVMPCDARVMLELHSLPESGTKTEAAMTKALGSPGLTDVVCISASLAEDLVRMFGPLRSGLRVSVAHDGADAGSTPSPRESRSTFTVGYFGHLYPGKGMELIAEIAPGVPEIQFEVYGGTDADLARWRSQSLSKNINLHGHVPHDRVRPLMESCDALIAPYGVKVSHVAGGDIGRWMAPLKLFEYMAAGRTIVASDLPVIREVLTDGETALLCSPQNASAWHEAIRRLRSDPQFAAKLGSAGRHLLLKKFTWGARAATILALGRVS